MKKSAEQLFSELGFKKNKSECYNDEHILYEKDVEFGDVFTAEFKDGSFIYRNATYHCIRMDRKLLKAVNRQMKEIEKIKKENNNSNSHQN